MKATIITIGDEILIGQIVDTNSTHIAKELTRIGVEVQDIWTVKDEYDEIYSAFAKAEKRSEIVICTGGLGPTKDDVTKNVICGYFDDQLKLDKDVLKHVEHIFEKYVKQPVVQMNRDQALVPSTAQIMHNEYGTAPGLHMNKEGLDLFVMPGVPFEMKNLMRDHVLPYISSLPGREALVHRTLLTVGLGESSIATRIEDWEDALPDDIRLAYLPSFGAVRLRLSSRGENTAEIEERVQHKYDELEKMLADIAVGEDQEEGLIVYVADLLKKANLSVATAESLTGGRIAEHLTTIQGASQFFKGSTITYATECKTSVLGIPAHEIEENDVVSAYTAREMAKAAKKMFESDYAIATTGNAGPTKGDSKQPIGRVYIGIASPEGVQAYEFDLGKGRERVTQRAVNKSFELLRRDVLKNYKSVLVGTE